jgi:hypothetical protein
MFDRLAAAARRTTQRAFSTSRTVAYTPAGGAPLDLSGIAVFREAHAEEVLGSDGPEIATVAAQLSLDVADLGQEPAEGDQVTIGAMTFPDVRPQTDYVVATIQRDGEGGVLLELEEV